MFRFDFNLQDAEEERVDEEVVTEIAGVEGTHTSKSPPLIASTVEGLLAELPPLISYSPLRIPLSNDRDLTLLRRDLFDARFQLISESPTAKISEDLAFIDAPSDLVPGIYEGGLKTWECSSDLVSYLEEVDAPIATGTRAVIEIGCGTAIPSLYLLRKLFFADSDPEGDSNRTKTRVNLHLQDYNSTVLQLVTLPNIILTWYASSASNAYRASQSPTIAAADNSEPGELALTPDLLSAFLRSLRERRIDLMFFSGPWADFEAHIRQKQVTYDLVLTSETIYRSVSLPSLVSLLRSACTLHGATQHLPRDTPSKLCLVAAKIIYFGVGGGVDEFNQAVLEAGGQPETVLEKKDGVGRRIIKVNWNQSE